MSYVFCYLNYCLAGSLNYSTLSHVLLLNEFGNTGCLNVWAAEYGEAGIFDVVVFRLHTQRCLRLVGLHENYFIRCINI